jgi:hypothetical protein
MGETLPFKRQRASFQPMCPPPRRIPQQRGATSELETEARLGPGCGTEYPQQQHVVSRGTGGPASQEPSGNREGWAKS